jgi:hypothetical protein
MIPEGELLRSRVLADLAPALSDVLDRRLDGYALISSRGSLLGRDDGRGVITFEAGVPALAYHSGTDRGGPPALSDVGPSPYRFELYALEADALEFPHRIEELRVPPGAVAERLADDPGLADRTRESAPRGGVVGERTDDAVEAFLEDESAIDDIRRSAREEALDRADEWNFSDAIGE